MWFCFHQLLQKDLDEVKIHWNTHYIRESNHSNVPGKPDELYHLPECFGVEECLTSLTEDDVDYSFEHCIENVEKSNDFQDYFSYVSEVKDLQNPMHWKAAPDLYHQLQQFAINGD